MPLTDKKISESEYTGNDISGLSNTPSADGMGASTLKARFDALIKLVLIPKYNQLIDMLVSVATGSSGARQIGMEATPDFMYQNVHDALVALNTTKDTIENVNLKIAEAQIPTSLPRAEYISVADAGGYYVGTEVETVLAEVATGKSPTGHTHDDRYYTETEVNTLLSSKSATSHLHDDRYYTETELNNGQLDTRYYTETEVNTELAKKPDKPSLLSAITTWADTDLVLVEDGTSPKKMTVANLKSLVARHTSLKEVYILPISKVVPNNTWVAIAAIDLPIYTACLVEVTLGGLQNGVGSFGVSKKFGLSRENALALVTSLSTDLFWGSINQTANVTAVVDGNGYTVWIYARSANATTASYTGKVVVSGGFSAVAVV